MEPPREGYIRVLARRPRGARRGEFRQRPVPGQAPSAPPADRSRVLTIVAGLPRSGTSMMMQMLAAAGIAPFTDDKRLPKAQRKQLQVETAPHKSDRAKLIKMADKISNLRGITHSPPVNWDFERKQEYFAWAARVVDGCRGVNPWLERIFDQTHRDGLARRSA